MTMTNKEKDMKALWNRVNSFMHDLLKEDKPILAVLKAHDDDERSLLAILKTCNIKEFKVGDNMYTYEQMEEILPMLSKTQKTRFLPVPRKLPMSTVEAALKMLGKPRWAKCSEEDKLDVLWELGMCCNSREEVYQNGILVSNEYYPSVSMYRDDNNKVVYGWIITASERTDKEWLSAGYASQDAKLFTEDAELAKDLAEMGKGGQYGDTHVTFKKKGV